MSFHPHPVDLCSVVKENKVSERQKTESIVFKNAVYNVLVIIYGCNETRTLYLNKIKFT